MTNSNSHRVLGIVTGLLCLLTGVCAHASSFSVSPTRILLSRKHQGITVRLLNTGDDLVTVQVRVVTWSLKDNQDVYENTDEVLLNPPIFTLQPDQPQLMRLGLRHPRAEMNEIAYRLLVEEVPPPPKPGISLRTVLRISIPIFVEQQGTAKKQVNWKAEATPVGVKITATNNGNVHVEVKHLDLLPEGSTVTPSSKIVLDYLLPGQSHEWVFEDPQIRSAQKFSLTAVTDEGNFNASLVATTQ